MKLFTEPHKSESLKSENLNLPQLKRHNPLNL